MKYLGPYYRLHAVNLPALLKKHKYREIQPGIVVPERFVSEYKLRKGTSERIEADRIRHEMTILENVSIRFIRDVKSEIPYGYSLLWGLIPVQPIYKKITCDLYDADPNCEHEQDPMHFDGVLCRKCGGWFCY